MNSFTIEQTMTVLMTMKLPTEVKIGIHLRNNFDQPLPKELVPVCQEAIMLDAYGFDWDATEIALPNSVSFQGRFQATLRDVIEAHHLQWFLKDTEDNGRKMSEGGFRVIDISTSSEAEEEK